MLLIASLVISIETGNEKEMLKNVIYNEFVEYLGQPGLLTVVSKTEYKCQLSVKFWPFVSCQLTTSRPSHKTREPGVFR